MDLSLITSRMAEILPIVDEETTTQRASRSGSGGYIPCVGTIWEDDLTREIIDKWSKLYPDELPEYSEKWLEIRYPNKRGNCDLCIRSSDYSPSLGEPPYEWAIEMKYVRFIGDNGKNNDYGVTKVASPYRKDRSSVLDAERLSEFSLAINKAIIMYGFEFGPESYKNALQWCNNTEGEEKKKNFEEQAFLKDQLRRQTNASESQFTTLVGNLRQQYKSIEADIVSSKNDLYNALYQELRKDAKTHLRNYKNITQRNL